MSAFKRRDLDLEKPTVRNYRELHKDGEIIDFGLPTQTLDSGGEVYGGFNFADSMAKLAQINADGQAKVQAQLRRSLGVPGYDEGGDVETEPSTGAPINSAIDTSPSANAFAQALQSLAQQSQAAPADQSSPSETFASHDFVAPTPPAPRSGGVPAGAMVAPVGNRGASTHSAPPTPSPGAGFKSDPVIDDAVNLMADAAMKTGAIKETEAKANLLANQQLQQNLQKNQEFWNQQ
jgi:hypothetical protein